MEQLIGIIMTLAAAQGPSGNWLPELMPDLPQQQSAPREAPQAEVADPMDVTQVTTATVGTEDPADNIEMPVTPAIESPVVSKTELPAGKKIDEIVELPAASEDAPVAAVPNIVKERPELSIATLSAPVAEPAPRTEAFLVTTAVPRFEPGLGGGENWCQPGGMVMIPDGREGRVTSTEGKICRVLAYGEGFVSLWTYDLIEPVYPIEFGVRAQKSFGH